MKNGYEVRGEVVAIKIMHKGKELEAIVDVDELPKLHDYKYSWNAHLHPHTGTYYVIGYSPGKRISLHRYIMDDPFGLVIDHINHDTLDNRKCNLRAVSVKENSLNRRGAANRSKSRIRGVHWNEEKRAWQARISTREGRVFLGYFKDKEEAKRAVEKAREKFAV